MFPFQLTQRVQAAPVPACRDVRRRSALLAAAVAASVAALTPAPALTRSDEAWLKEACLAWRTHIDDRLRWLRGTSLLPRETEDEVKNAIDRASRDCDEQPAPGSLSRLRSIAVFLEAVAQSDQQ